MEFQEILEKRRAINFFDPDRDVDEATLRNVFEDAAKTPSSFNLQPWKVVVLRDPSRKQALRKLAFNQSKVTEAPVVLIILADRDGWKEGNPIWEKRFETGFKPDQREWFVNNTKALYGWSPEASQAFATKNAGFFAMSLMYAASNLGLDTHPMDGFDHEAVRKEFNIPDNYWIEMLIAVGYAKSSLEIHSKAWRQSYEDIVIKKY
jgi:nitroreductase